MDFIEFAMGLLAVGAMIGATLIGFLIAFINYLRN